MIMPLKTWSRIAACAWIATRSIDITQEADELSQAGIVDPNTGDREFFDFNPWQSKGASLDAAVRAEKVRVVDGRYSRADLKAVWPGKRGQPRMIKDDLYDAKIIAEIMLLHDLRQYVGPHPTRAEIARKFNFSGDFDDNSRDHTSRRFRRIFNLAQWYAFGLIEMTAADGGSVNDLLRRLQEWQLGLRKQTRH